MANNYLQQGKYEQALKQYEKSLGIQREAGDREGEGVTLNNIATIYYEQDKPSKAVKYHAQALAIQRELGNRAREANSCWNIGTTYYSMGELVKAEEYIALSVEIAEQINHPDLENDRKTLERVRAILKSRWRLWLYNKSRTLLNWLRAVRGVE